MVYTPFLAGQRVTAGGLSTLIVGETMAWTNLTALGTFQSGFAASTTPAPRMRKLMVAGTERWEFEGRINVTGTLTANTDTDAFHFNTGFRVGSERGYEVLGSSSNFYGLRLTFQSSGQLHVGLPTAGGSGTGSFLLDQITISNPLV